MNADSRLGFNTVYVWCDVDSDTPLSKPDSDGRKGDIIERLIITASSNVDTQVDLSDGATVIPIMPLGIAKGVYCVEIGAASVNGAWSVATTADVTVIAVGKFS